MLDLQTINKFDDKSVGYFRFKKFDADNYLLTNEVGQYIFLKEKDFKDFITGQLSPKANVYKELRANLFIKDEAYTPTLIEKYRARNSFLKFGPSLHIIVVTLRCNHSCIYCHASAGNQTDKSLDMDLAMAKKIVDVIFKSTNNAIAIEFQGGEPLLNWPVVKFIVQYANEKNKLEQKDLLIRLVSNFSLLDEAKMKFFIDNKVHFCTSLDGDEETHNFNRKYSCGNSFAEASKWIKRIKAAYVGKFKGKKKDYYNVGALITITRKTLGNYKKVIDAYLDLGIRSIYLRYLNPYGFAMSAQENIWYTPEEFLDFYQKTLDYILAKNKEGKLFLEATAVTYLRKILLQEEPHNLDMRSPCGAGIGQMAYNYNGDVYTCDEGRMISRMGDEMFKLGNINENSFEQLINNNLCKSICLASCTTGLPGHSDQVYQPYWGTCPVYNYSLYGNIFPQMKNNFKWQIDEKILDYIFVKLQDKKNRDIFMEWAKRAKPPVESKFTKNNV